MVGFVRAVAIAERPFLAGDPGPDHPGLVTIDEARRRGVQVILVSDRSFGELTAGDTDLLRHFDGVVAEHGGALSVGPGPITRVEGEGSGPHALLEVLARLDVDRHDTLGIVGGGTDRDLMGLLEVTVDAPGSPALAGPAALSDPADLSDPAALSDPVALFDLADLAPTAGAVGAAHGEDLPGVDAGGADGTHARATDPGVRALRAVLDARTARGPLTGSLRRNTVRLDRPGRPEARVPGGHANILLCAVTAEDGPQPLLLRWTEAGYSSVVVDLDGRHTAVAGPHGPVDAAGAGWLEQLTERLLGHGRPVVVDLSGVTGSERSRRLALALGAVRGRRAASGRPHWLVIDPVEPVLSDPDLPPEALNLAVPGHCLVRRRHDTLPAVLPPGLDAVLPCGPTCTLTAPSGDHAVR